jgi:hypothetical protein
LVFRDTWQCELHCLGVLKVWLSSLDGMVFFELLVPGGKTPAYVRACVCVHARARCET